MIALLLAAATTIAAPGSPPGGRSPTRGGTIAGVQLPPGPVHVEAKYIEVLHGNVVRASQGIDLTAPGIRAHADQVTYDRLAGTVFVSGNVSLELVVENVGNIQPGESEAIKLRADSATIDVRTKAGELENAEIEGAGITLAGRKITRSASGNYKIEHARFSPCGCEGGNPSWEITAAKVTARKSGIAVMENGVLRAKGVPIFWLPIGFAPYSSERASGFLSPVFVEGGKNDGLILTLPFYVAIARDWDLSIEPGLNEKRGPFAGEALRFANSRGRGEIDFTMHDDREVKSEAAALTGNSADYSRTRWYANARLQEEIARNTTIRARAELSGDDRYDYDYGLTQMERSRPEYENDAFIEHHGSMLGMVVGSTYYQDLRIVGSAGPYNSAQTVSRLGAIDASAGGLPLVGTGLARIGVDLDGRYDFFDNVGSPQAGFRHGGELEATPRRQVEHARLAPAVTLPVSFFGDGVRLDAVAGTVFDASADPLGGDPRARLAPMIGGDGRAEWWRTWEPTPTLKIQHRVGPFVSWRYVPRLFGDPMTSYEDRSCDSGTAPPDHTGPAPACGSQPVEGSQLDAGISNRLLYRRTADAPDQPVRELLELQLFERFFPSGPHAGQTIGNLDLRTGPLRMDLDFALNDDDGRVSTAGGRAATRADAPEGISIEYAYAPDRASHQATGGGWLKLAELTGGRERGIAGVLRTITLEGAARYDFNATPLHRNGRSLSTTAGAAYESPCGCWGVHIGASQEADRENLTIPASASVTGSRLSFSKGIAIPVSAIHFSIDLHPPTTLQRFTQAPGGA